MGADKNFLQVDGEPMLSRACRVCMEVAPTWVVGRSDQLMPELHGASRLADAEYGELGGPLVGIATGLTELGRRGAKFALVCAGDDVAFGAAALRARVLALRASDPDCAGVCVEAQGRAQPLASAVRVELAGARAQALLEAGEARARIWAEDFEALMGERYGEVRDLDTPADVEARAKSSSERS